MPKYRISFFVNHNVMYFECNSYIIDNGRISFITIPDCIHTSLVGSYMIEELRYEK